MTTGVLLLALVATAAAHPLAAHLGLACPMQRRRAVPTASAVAPPAVPLMRAQASAAAPASAAPLDALNAMLQDNYDFNRLMLLHWQLQRAPLVVHRNGIVQLWVNGSVALSLSESSPATDDLKLISHLSLSAFVMVRRAGRRRCGLSAPPQLDPVALNDSSSVRLRSTQQVRQYAKALIPAALDDMRARNISAAALERGERIYDATVALIHDALANATATPPRPLTLDALRRYTASVIADIKANVYDATLAYLQVLDHHAQQMRALMSERESATQCFFASHVDLRSQTNGKISKF